MASIFSGDATFPEFNMSGQKIDLLATDDGHGKFVISIMDTTNPAIRGSELTNYIVELYRSPPSGDIDNALTMAGWVCPDMTPLKLHRGDIVDQDLGPLHFVIYGLQEKATLLHNHWHSMTPKQRERIVTQALTFRDKLQNIYIVPSAEADAQVVLSQNVSPDSGHDITPWPTALRPHREPIFCEMVDLPNPAEESAERDWVKHCKPLMAVFDTYLQPDGKSECMVLEDGIRVYHDGFHPFSFSSEEIVKNFSTFRLMHLGLEPRNLVVRRTRGLTRMRDKYELIAVIGWDEVAFRPSPFDVGKQDADLGIANFNKSYYVTFRKLVKLHPMHSGEAGKAAAHRFIELMRCISRYYSVADPATLRLQHRKTTYLNNQRMTWQGPKRAWAKESTGSKVLSCMKT